MKKFLLILFLLCGSAIQGYAQYPRISQMTLTERIAYDMYKDEIIQSVDIEGKEQWLAIKRDYKIPQNKQADLIKLIKLREIRKLTYNFIYPNDAEKRMAAKRRIDIQFQDSIDAILLLKNKLAGELTTYALNMRPGFLSEKQQDSLMSQAIKMCQKKRYSNDADIAMDDISALQSILTEKQQKTVIHLYNVPEINRQMNEVWQTLKEHGYDARYDSAQACKHIFQYINKDLFVRTIYKGAPDLQKQALRALAPERPEEYRVYKSILVREELERKQKREKERESSNKPQPVF